MNPLSQFLEKIKTKLDTGKIERELVAESVLEVTGVTILLQNIEIKNGTARIKGSPALKSEIFLKKSSVLEKINLKAADSKKIHDLL